MNKNVIIYLVLSSALTWGGFEAGMRWATLQCWIHYGRATDQYISAIDAALDQGRIDDVKASLVAYPHHVGYSLYQEQRIREASELRRFAANLILGKVESKGAVHTGMGAEFKK